MAVTVFRQMTITLPYGGWATWALTGIQPGQIFQWYATPSGVVGEIFNFGSGYPRPSARIDPVRAVQVWSMTAAPAFDPPVFYHLVTFRCDDENPASEAGNLVTIDVYGLFFE